MIPRPTTRLLALLELLQARDRVSGAELARHLEVDARSVRRYIAMLGEIGIPVEATRGPVGGYRLRPGYKLPPLMLTNEEAVALALALRALPRLGLTLAPATIAGAQAKLERVLPVGLRERVRAVAEGVALDPAPATETAEGALVATLSEAARQGRRVWLHYRSRGAEGSERLVEPYGIVQWSRAWYLVGYCHLRAGPRLFRLDRISRAEPREETFTPPPDFDSYGYVVRAMAAYPGRWPIEVALTLTLAEARRQVGEAMGTLEPIAGGVLFRGRVDDLEGAARWLVTLRCPLVVRQPPELRAALRDLAREVAALAEDG
jgi:predicted DNA-binding transcriptional regulator YafY